MQNDRPSLVLPIKLKADLGLVLFCKDRIKLIPFLIMLLYKKLNTEGYTKGTLVLLVTEECDY